MTQKRDYFVPDLSPEQRTELAACSPEPKFIFVAESPHVNEVEPENRDERRPLCGSAGREWWTMIGRFVENDPSPNVSRERLLRLCQKHGLVIMNAVQVPLDPKITKRFPDADPIHILGFAKITGAYSFKKRKSSPEMAKTLESLRRRLNYPSVAHLPIYCLGNDAEWFVSQALGPEEARRRILDKIPHPSAWWRKGGYFRKVAREKLEKILLTESRC